MYLAANVALIVEWARLRRRGVRKNPWLWVIVPMIGVVHVPAWLSQTCSILPQCGGREGRSFLA
jgi:hypothetical protein